MASSCASNVLFLLQRYYEKLRMGGSGQGVELLEVMVAVLEAAAATFELTLSSYVGALTKCATLLLKSVIACFHVSTVL